MEFNANHPFFSKLVFLPLMPLNKFETHCEIAAKEDIARWNLIPFLSLNSGIDYIKINILPRLLYLFQTLPSKNTN